jgi:hypothetical protein
MLLMARNNLEEVEEVLLIKEEEEEMVGSTLSVKEQITLLILVTKNMVINQIGAEEVEILMQIWWMQKILKVRSIWDLQANMMKM